MGNREDLLAGARRCLYEKGYVHTSARDIAAASGTSLASIGYHFGSKEALLKAALVQATEEWGNELKRAVSADIDPGTSPMNRFESTWAGVIDSFAAHRDLWATHFRMLTEIENVPREGQSFVDALQQGRRGLASLFLNTDAMGDERIRAVGAFYHALLTGVMAQWLVDPEHAPSAHDLTEALRTIVAAAGPGVENADEPDAGSTGRRRDRRAARG